MSASGPSGPLVYNVFCVSALSKCLVVVISKLLCDVLVLYINALYKNL